MEIQSRIDVDCLLIVAIFSTFDDAVGLFKVCKSWKRLDCEMFWKAMFQKYYGYLVEFGTFIVYPKSTWKISFQKIYATIRTKCNPVFVKRELYSVLPPELQPKGTLHIFPPSFTKKRLYISKVEWRKRYPCKAGVRRRYIYDEPNRWRWHHGLLSITTFEQQSMFFDRIKASSETQSVDGNQVRLRGYFNHGDDFYYFPDSTRWTIELNIEHNLERILAYYHGTLKYTPDREYDMRGSKGLLSGGTIDQADSLRDRHESHPPMYLFTRYLDRWAFVKSKYVIDDSFAHVLLMG